MSKEIEGMIITILHTDGTEEVRHATKSERGWSHGRVAEILSPEEMREPGMVRKVRDRIRQKESRPNGAANGESTISSDQGNL